MKLYDEEELRKKNKKNKKARNIILVSIIFTVLLIIILMGIIYYLVYNPNKITINLNGRENETLENLIITRTADNGSSILYFPIRKVANTFKYNSGDGDYGANVENSENCYIESVNEVLIFTEDSNIIYRIDKNTNKNTNEAEYEEVIIDNSIIKDNDVLYVDTEGLSKAFNLNIKTNAKKKTLNITTLDTLIASAEKLVTNNKLGKLDAKFVNQKAILDNMLVLESEEYDGQKGVINYSTKEEILGFQYDDITYIPEKESFLIKKNNKVGIIGSDRMVKIKPLYDKLILISNEYGLYLAEDGARKGVVDENGNTKIYFEYEKIGVDLNAFKENGLKNGYVLLGKLIPVKNNGMWFFFKIQSTQNSDGSKNVQCTRLQDEQFSGIGCISKVKRGTVSNLMVLEDYGMVIVQKQGMYYGFMNQEGILPIGAAFTDIYAETTSGQKNYYMIYFKDGKAYNAVQELEKVGYSKINNK